MTRLRPLLISGKEVLPLIEGGKGLNLSTGETAGAWAAAGAVGTVSAVNADSWDEAGVLVPQIYHGRTRIERHQELIDYAIRGGIAQVRVAHEVSRGQGRIHINVLWEMGGAEEVLEGVLSATKGMVHGVTCGAGMPYRVAEIAARHEVYYYPIVSSDRAFRALWKRSYSRHAQWLGGVVYEDPWRAGGHNGLSNNESPTEPQDPLPRVQALRSTMRDLGVADIPVVMAGGVWTVSEWSDWIDNPDLGPVAFQLGTRPLLVAESPVALAWRDRLMSLKKGDVLLHRFSPTGFYSSAVHNAFIEELVQRSQRQVGFRPAPEGEFDHPHDLNNTSRQVFVRTHDVERIHSWIAAGFTQSLQTPEETLIFVTPEKGDEIRKDQRDCMGCLSACAFSSWSQGEKGSTGHRPDPRSFCIQKTLRDVAHGESDDHNLVFAGHNAYRFATDPLFANGRVPTMKEFVEALAEGN